MADFNIVITVPDEKIADVRDTLADAFGWTAESPNDKAEVIRLAVRRFLRESYKAEKVNKDAEAARLAAVANADAIDFD